MSIQLAIPEKGTIPQCAPNLMPFNIKYTGTAPVSTYFRPKPRPVEADLPTNVVTESQEGMSQLSTATDAQNLAESDANPVTTIDAVSKEGPLVAAFRGRTIRGTRISVPHGYTGVVLVGTDTDKTKKPPPSPPPLGRRPSRRSGRVIHVDEDDGPQDVDMDEDGEGVDADIQEEEEELPTRTLTLASIFSSFMVWNPDIVVDEGRDEYIRSLNEWTTLSAMVCHAFNPPVSLSSGTNGLLDTPQRWLSVARPKFATSVCTPFTLDTSHFLPHRMHVVPSHFPLAYSVERPKLQMNISDSLPICQPESCRYLSGVKLGRPGGEFFWGSIRSASTCRRKHA